jgi:hypothetical protein
MGEFRDMGIPAQVVKKKSCTSGEAASAGAGKIIFKTEYLGSAGF